MSNCALSQTFDGHSCLNTLFISLAILGIFAGLRARAYQHLKHLKLFFGRIGCSVSSKVDQKAATQVLSKIWVTYLMQSQRQATQTFCLLSLFKQNFKEGLIIFICSIIRDLRRVWIEILKLWKIRRRRKRKIENGQLEFKKFAASDGRRTYERNWMWVTFRSTCVA